MLTEENSIFSKEKIRQTLTLLIIYTAANIPVLLNTNGIYWDDWTLYNHSFSTIKNAFKSASGSIGIITTYIHYVLLNYCGVYTYRILTLLLYFLSGLFLYEIFTNISMISRKSRFWLTLFFLLAPLFNSKIVLINFPYTLFNTFFFFGCYLTAKWRNRLSIIKRLLIESIFFLSFIVNSHLVFFAVVLLYLFYQTYQREVALIKNIRNFSCKYLDFTLLPILYFILKTIYFRPSGLYAGYNDISIFLILKITDYYRSFVESLFRPLIESLSESIYLYPILILLIFAIPFIKNKRPHSNHQSVHRMYIYALLLLFGVGLFMLGALPYIAVGKLPRSHYSFHSRFQLLLPLGFSIITTATVNLIFSKIFKPFILCILALSLAIYNFNEQVRWNLVWYFSLSIEKNLMINPAVVHNNTFLISYKTQFPRLQDHIRTGYVFSGMARKVFQTDNRLLVEPKSEIESYKIACRDKSYNCSSWKYSPPLNLEIEENTKSGLGLSKIKDLRTFLRLKYLEKYNSSEFDKEISNLTKLNITK